MPWKETSVMNERAKFVIRHENGERMTDLCREFGISRKTGYKIWKRYLEKGLTGLFDESKRPGKMPHQTSDYVVDKILKLKEQHPTWGAQKLRHYLIRNYSHLHFPSSTTFHNILLKNDLVQTRRKRRFKAFATNLSVPDSPNDLWCADFKGQFRTNDQRYCYPLTITDQHSRFLLATEALHSTKEGGAFEVFEEAFRKYGLPQAIKTDNGAPFAAPCGVLGLSKLSVWWLRLGIKVERITPGKPQENGSHERMHLTLKQDVCSEVSQNILMQQEAFDKFRDIYNFKRPHAGIENKTPAELYTRSQKLLPGKLAAFNYVNYDRVALADSLGRIYIGKHYKYMLPIARALAGQELGLKRIEENILRVNFMDIVIGHIDDKEGKFDPMDKLIREN